MDRPLTLMIHGGLNKAGSTYLQDLFSTNAALLLEHGIHYPNPVVTSGPADAQSGNAADLALAFESGDLTSFMYMLEQLGSETRRLGCQRLLLSNESIYHGMVMPGRIGQFATMARARSFLDIQVLIVFRNPAAHAISAYCHRAGTMQLASFDQWLRDGWEFPSDLKSFLDNAAATDLVELRLASLPHDSLIDVATRWIGVDPLVRPAFARSNVSINCVEAELVRRLYRESVPAAKELRTAFRRLPKDLKASDAAVRDRFEWQALDYLAQYRAALCSLEGMLGHTLQRPELDQDGEEPAGISSGELALSAEQADVLLATLRRPRAWRDGSVGRLGRRTVHALRRGLS